MNEAKLRRRNYLALSTEGTFFTTALAFLDVNAVIPVFIFTFTKSLQLAGLATTIMLAASVVSQTLVAPYVKSIRNVPKYITWMMFLFRPLPLLMIPVLFSGLPSMTIVFIFLFIYMLLFAGDGLVVVPWLDLFGRTILPSHRGKVFGNQQLFGGIGGLAAGFIIKYVLENQEYSDAKRYAIIFSCSAAAFIISSVAMIFAHDLPHPVTPKPKKNWHYYAQLPGLLKLNPAFGRLSMIRILSIVTGMIAPFFILFGGGIYHLDASQISTLIYLQITGGLVGGIVWGHISSKIGNKYVIYAAQMMGLLMPLYALALHFLRNSNLPWQLLMPLVLVNGISMGSWMGVANYTIDIVDEKDRPEYLLLNSLITFPLTILAFIAGIVADKVGFIPLFLISSSTAGIGIFLARKLKSPAQLVQEHALLSAVPTDQ